MQTIRLQSANKHTSFEIHAYKAGESVTVFKGAAGTFGKAARSKTGGIVYVTKGPGGIQAQDMDIDNVNFWAWVQDYMQKGLNAEAELDRSTLTTLG